MREYSLVTIPFYDRQDRISRGKTIIPQDKTSAIPAVEIGNDVWSLLSKTAGKGNSEEKNQAITGPSRLAEEWGAESCKNKIRMIG
jgi:hypothetical protein